jgi:hypothetical protein
MKGTGRRVSFTITLTSRVDIEVRGTLTMTSGGHALFTASIAVRIRNGQSVLHIPDVSIPDGVSEVTLVIDGTSIPAVAPGAIEIGVATATQTD